MHDTQIDPNFKPTEPFFSNPLKIQDQDPIRLSPQQDLPDFPQTFHINPRQTLNFTL